MYEMITHYTSCQQCKPCQQCTPCQECQQCQGCQQCQQLQRGATSISDGIFFNSPQYIFLFTPVYFSRLSFQANKNPPLSLSLSFLANQCTFMLKSSSVTGNILFLAMSGKIIYNLDYMITIYSNSHNHSRTGIDPLGNVLILLTILKFVLSSSTDNGFDQFPARSESIGLSPRSLCCSY